MKRLINLLKSMIMQLWEWIPFGILCKFKYINLFITVRKDGWIIISDGDSNDMLQITMVSDNLVSEINKQLEMCGYKNKYLSN